MVEKSGQNHPIIPEIFDRLSQPAISIEPVSKSCSISPLNPLIGSAGLGSTSWIALTRKGAGPWWPFCLSQRSSKQMLTPCFNVLRPGPWGLGSLSLAPLPCGRSDSQGPMDQVGECRVQKLGFVRGTFRSFGVSSLPLLTTRYRAVLRVAARGSGLLMMLFARKIAQAIDRTGPEKMSLCPSQENSETRMTQLLPRGW